VLQDEREQCMKLGVEGYMTKPYTLLKLHAELTKHLPGRVPPLGIQSSAKWMRLAEPKLGSRSVHNVRKSETHVFSQTLVANG
jgi:hypothetical protein